jgi:hypothetical protein
MENVTPLTSSLIRKFPDMKASIDVLGTIDGDFSTVPSGKAAIAVMGESGDTKLIWSNSSICSPCNPSLPVTLKGRYFFALSELKSVRAASTSSGFSGSPKEGRMIMVPALVGG